MKHFSRKFRNLSFRDQLIGKTVLPEPQTATVTRGGNSD